MNHLHWRTRRIGDVSINIIDGDRSAKYPKRDEFQDEGVLFLNTTNIIDDRLDLTAANFISEEKYSTISKGRIQPLDIIMTTRGSVGKVALYNRQDKGLINAQMLILRADGESIDPRFLFHLVRSEEFQRKLKNFASGSAQPQIPITDLRAVTICYPDIGVQREIASILSAYDDLIENNTRRIRVLEQMAQMLYREWFVNFRFPGYEKVKMVESESGQIPRGWIGSTLGDLCDDVRRSVNPSDLPAETPYIGLEHMPRKCVALSEWGQSGQVQSTKLRFNRGDILFGKIRPYFHKVGIAPVNGVCSSDAIVIVPKEAKYSSVVLLCVSSDDFVHQATQTSQGTKMPRANWGVLARYPIALPGTHLLDRFNDIVNPMIQLLNNLLFRNRCLRKTRDLLLPKLVSGEISVQQIESEAAAQTV